MLKSKKSFTVKKFLVMLVIVSMLIPNMGYFSGFESAYAVGANLALNKTVVASSTYSGYPVGNAVDGNASTRWSSNFTNSEWIYVDLGSVQSINEVILKWDGAYAIAYQIQVSNDANNWSNVYSTTTGDGVTDDITFTATSARYVRMNGTQRANIYYGYSLWEFEVYGSTSSSSNLALNKTVSISSTYTGYPAANAVDGSGTTRWSSNFSDPQWIYVDLGSVQTVNRVLLNWDGAYATSYKIQVSNDTSNWTDMYSTTTGNGGIDDITFTTTNARYVRMYGTARATVYGYSLWEFEVYGSGAVPTPTPAPTSPPTPSGLVANWKFDEGTGTTAVDSQGGFNGTITNATWVDGKYGKALDFNGTSSRVTISPTIGTYSSFTMAMWVKPRSYMNNMNTLIASNGWETGDLQFRLEQKDKNISGGICGNTSMEDPLYGTCFSSINSLGTPGNWYHVAVTYSASNNAISYYINGVLDKTITTKNGNSAVLGAMRIGSWDLDGSRTFDGLIDNVQIYNRVLTADEIGTQFFGRTPAIITGTTNKPNSSTYKKNETATATISISRINTAITGQTLQITIKDVNGNTVSSQNPVVTPDGNGNWTSSTITLPTANLGYYYLTAQLTTGEKLKKVGTRPASILPYIVVVDPALRTAGTENSFFGMEGNIHPTAIDMKQYLGMNAEQTFTFDWSEMEPNYAGEFAAKVAAGTAPIPNVNYFQIFACGSFPTWALVTPGGARYGALTAAGQTAYYNYYYALGQYINSKLPNRARHIYQIGWEPVAPWHWDGTNADIITMMRLAYQALHAADPKAFVIGPTYAGIDGSHLTWADELFQLGLGNWIDGYSNHAYVSLPPEAGNFKSYIDQTKAKLQYYKGSVTEIYGTEQGVSTRDDFALELSTAPELIRANLIALGEGMKQNQQFYPNDYINEPGFGFYHNLDPITYPWSSNVLSPKPIAAAYSNMSYLLEGYTSSGLISGLPSGTMAYTYTKGASVIKAAWDYSGANQTVNIPVSGVSTVTVYDWMGGSTTKTVSGGYVNITLSKNPQYIKY